MSSDEFSLVLQRLKQIERAVTELLWQRTAKGFYEIEGFAEVVNTSGATSSL